MSGERFGIAGKLCVTCYARLNYRLHHPEVKPRNKGRLPEMIYRA
jgi:hypothetical protein